MTADPSPGDPLPEAVEFEALIQRVTDGALNADAREPILAAAQSLRKRLGKADALNRRLSEVSARAAELVAELQQKNGYIATANAHAAELVAEIEIKSVEIRTLNRSLSEANARSAELVAENELRSLELSRANTYLSDAVEQKSKWVGFAAHDLKGGIGAIHGFASLLLEDSTSGENPAGESAHPLELIRGESARLLELLSALLEVTSIEQGRISLKREPMDLSTITRGSIDVHSWAASAKNQTIVIAEEAPDARVVADPHRIRQVIDNLLSNAIKFSLPGTRVSIALQKAGDELVWSVTDGGPGLAEGDFVKLFHSFQKLSAVPTGGETSTGLGLAISRSIVELHLGRIWAENRGDAQGARFAFALPLREKKAGSYRVFVVDPDSESSEKLRATLIRLGHFPSTVSEVPEIARISAAGKPEVILADIHVPIREIMTAVSPCPPVIALSYLDQRVEDRAPDWDGFLLKPVDADLLQAMLHRVVRLTDRGRLPL